MGRKLLQAFVEALLGLVELAALLAQDGLSGAESSLAREIGRVVAHQGLELVDRLGGLLDPAEQEQGRGPRVEGGEVRRLRIEDELEILERPLGAHPFAQKGLAAQHAGLEVVRLDLDHCSGRGDRVAPVAGPRMGAGQLEGRRDGERLGLGGLAEGPQSDARGAGPGEGGSVEQMGLGIVGRGFEAQAERLDGLRITPLALDLPDLFDRERPVAAGDQQEQRRPHADADERVADEQAGRKSAESDGEGPNRVSIDHVRILSLRRWDRSPRAPRLESTAGLR